MNLGKSASFGLAWLKGLLRRAVRRTTHKKQESLEKED